MNQLNSITETLIRQMKQRKSPILRTLVVDDNPDDADLISWVLADAGSDVAIAKTGEDAIAMVAKCPDCFSVIFIDLNLPRIDGVQTYKRISEITPKSHIILITGGDREIIPELDYVGVLKKPLTPEIASKIVNGLI